MSAAEADGCIAIGDDELDDLFSIFPSQGRILLALSGGADSSALLALAVRWCSLHQSGPELHAVTVDHGLRPHSRAEAESASRLAERLNVAHEVLTWEGEKPASGVEAVAREARYRLLAAFATECGSRHIATAHTLDDQAETVLMRLAAGSGPAGLAGMRKSEDRDGFTLLRPLLGLRKVRLVATLERDGISWAEDPMNVDPRFARARLRGAADVLAREGLTPDRLGRLAKRLARWDEALTHSAETLQRALHGLEFGGRPDGSVDGWALLSMPEELILRFVAAEIQAVGGLSPATWPRLERLETLWEAVMLGILRTQAVRRTLAGALVTLDEQGRLSFSRAPPRRGPHANGNPIGGKSVRHD